MPAWRSGPDVRPLLLLFTLALGTATAVAQEAAQDVPLEYRVKAAYLYNFVKFVEWPPEAAVGTLVICVAGRNPFATVLQDIVRNETIAGRPIEARVILEPDETCDVVFVPQGAATSAYLNAAGGKPMLTVGESPAYIRQGGIANFYINETGNVRFEINHAAAERAGLRISSRLLKLARIVTPTAP